MKWQDLSFGKQMAAGFGIVLTILAAIGVLSYTGVSGIVHNAEEVIGGNQLDGILAQKEVDHLNWVNRVNDLLTNDNVTTLEVQTDDHKCGFGKWLYGEGRKEAEALIPSLAPMLREIEAPHRALHESAIEMGEAFRQPHTGLALTLARRLTDHVKWTAQLGMALASEAGGLYSYQVQLKNAVDQAMSAVMKNDSQDEGGLKARQRRAMHIIKNFRYGSQGEGYFFIIDEDARMVMHALKPELEGEDVSEIKDPQGERIFREMARISQKKGDGFVTYQWPLPGSEKLAPKITYVKGYQPWGWVIGSGVYLDHTNHALLQRADDFAAGRPFSAGVQTDPTQCGLGRFLADSKTEELADTFPELKAILRVIKEPHEHLHHTAVLIEEKVNRLEMHAATQILNEDTQRTLDILKTHFDAAISAENKLQKGMDTATQVFVEKTVVSLNQVQRLLRNIRQETRQNVMTDEVMLKSAQGTKQNVTVLGVVAIIAGILLAFLIVRGIVSALQRIIEGLNSGADQVASASGQISSASQQLAEGSSEQAASIEETSASLEEMSSMTKQNADNAGQADNLMKEANQVVGTANESMAELTTSMEEISTASEKTYKIIKTIDEIAFQTNLLALNAAVEAARAGEAGAGFAVVADEVRNLAMRAADAAKNTAELIAETVKKVNNGSNLVTRTNENFNRVAESTGKVGQLVAEIAAASNEQAQGIEQTNTAVTEMDKVTQQNAANAEESASASEQLNAQAEQMKAMVGELMALMGGAHSNNRTTVTATSAKKVVSPIRPIVAAAINPAGGNEIQEMSPEKLIPTDDGDVKAF